MVVGEMEWSMKKLDQLSYQSLIAVSVYDWCGLTKSQVITDIGEIISQIQAQ